MKLIASLQADRRFHGTCPNCLEDFRLADALLFPADKPLPDPASARVTEFRAELKERRREIKESKVRMTTRAEVTTAAVNIGNIVEKILPTFEAFEYALADCRALFDPIDYVIFPGLHKKGTVSHISFVDVKSGGARLSPRQRQISAAVEDGAVRFKNIDQLEGR